MPRTPLTIIAIQYFCYFGVMGVFLPYFNLYCYHIGFSGMQIGLLSAVRSIILALLPMVWALLADRYSLQRPIYILCQFVSTLLWALFLLTVDFTLMLAIMAAYSVFFTPLIGFLESFAMDVLGHDKQRYGQLRAWGSVSFIAVVLTMGTVIQRFSIEVIVGLILAGSAVQALVSVGIPRPTAPAPDDKRGAGWRSLVRRPVLLFIAAAFLMLVSHGTYYGFFSIHLERLGYGGTFIGIAWALASVAEIAVMLLSRRIFRRFPVARVLQVTFAAAAVRWLALTVATSAAALLALQVLHALTYGAFHMASILTIDHLSGSRAKTLGQTVNNAVTYGLGLMAGFMLNGALFDSWGIPPLFVLSAVLAAAGGLLFWWGRPTGSIAAPREE